MDCFIDTEKTGSLFVDKILFDAGYPMLFVCKSEKNELFICVCCQNNKEGKKWLVSRTKAASIIKMLKNEISIRDLFLECSEIRLSIECLTDEKKVVFNQESDWTDDSTCLPKKNAFIDADEDEFSDEIDYYTNFVESSISYNSISSEIIPFEYENIPDFIQENCMHISVDEIMHTMERTIEIYKSTTESFSYDSKNYSILRKKSMLDDFVMNGKIGIAA